MPILSVVVPVLNERENVRLLVGRLRTVLQGLDWEVVFVDDDSDDGTADLCRSMATVDAHVRVIQRIGRYGLASASIEGVLATSSPYIAVMDGDLQHDERILPRMLQLAREKQLDLVVATRNAAGGSMGDFAQDRVGLSNLGRKFGRILTAQCPLTDPMSGFFVIDRNFFHEVMYDLSQMGFKILLDIVASSPRPVRFAEVGYTFGNRLHGESKLDASVVLEFLLLIADKLLGKIVPVRYALYALVGLSGVCVHMLTLAVLYRIAGTRLILAQGFATYVAMICNFFLNNWLTYRDRKLKGFSRLAAGLLLYVAGCSIGAAANLGVTRLMVENHIPWYIAGFLGMVVSSVWNYGIATVFTWKLLQQRRGRARALQEAVGGRMVAQAHRAGSRK